MRCDIRDINVHGVLVQCTSTSTTIENLSIGGTKKTMRAVPGKKPVFEEKKIKVPTKERVRICGVHRKAYNKTELKIVDGWVAHKPES